MNAQRALIDGKNDRGISPFDRGLTYGDGLFETLLVINGQMPHWQRHCERLITGCSRLKIAVPDTAQIEDEVRTVCADLPYAIARITITRGVGERGYRSAFGQPVTRVVAGFAASPVPSHWHVDGMRLRWCVTRLGMNPALAGIKHLNRLEQILARAEWNDAAIDEGLVCDSDGNVISAIAANIFLVLDGSLVTPSLEFSGVSGVARAAVLETIPECVVRRVRPEDVLQADEVFLTSSVRGILPVMQIDSHRFIPGPVIRKLQDLWRMRGWTVTEDKV